MEENLVIVEYPAKAKTIERFLGKNFAVKSSFGHIRDLAKKNLGIDLKNGFKPEYVISEDKKKVVDELKKAVKNAKIIWLASDEDREGEAISWHLYEVLKLKENNTRRIVFNEITKDAILEAIKNPRLIDKKLVDAQQARRILDRLVGFELSPVLWKKIKPSLSAGRVQSVAVRLLVEREREINDFKSSSGYKVVGLFNVRMESGKEYDVLAELPKKFNTLEETRKFLEKCKKAHFSVSDIVKKPSRKSPSPPFTTSTLQQEASRKLGFSVSQTMTVAQKLYEAGKITYMRTDSVNLSDTAIAMCRQTITSSFGQKYVQIRQYKTKSKGAQEAHEAIRPTYMDKDTAAGSITEKKLYELIWKRTIASQMSDAQLEKTNITITVSTTSENFIAAGEVIIFDGFLKVYIESSDEESEENGKGLLPPLKKGQALEMNSIEATERFSQHPPRYTEASLVKKLEELGIGRPSTYAPTISTIQQRGYSLREDRQGENRNFKVLILKNSTIKESSKTEITGTEKAKLFPTDIGIIVNDFLVEHFSDILDYNFTALVEKEFDLIAEGKLSWPKMIGKFYPNFHKKIESTLELTSKPKGERILGIDPVSGKEIAVRMGRYGPIVVIGDKVTDEKPRFASLMKNQLMETITLEEAINLFKLPRVVGSFEGSEVKANVGRFGPYVLHNNKFYSLKKGVDDPLEVSIDRAIELIDQKRIFDKNKLIKAFPEDSELQVLNGRFGPYISYQKENYKVPKTKNPAELSYKDCLAIISESKKKPARKKFKKK
jgi:DNA topoisomerase I